MLTVVLWQEMLLARERYVAAYVGSYVAVVFYCLCCLLAWVDISTDSSVYRIPGADYDAGSVNFLIKGIYGAAHNYLLFWILIAGILFSLLLYVLLAVFPMDPGSIDTRHDDFDALMQASLAAGGAPPAQLFCRSLLVRKPVRSKYCTNTGLVIARMDHYCIWLNVSVGYGNHRMFMLFLISHATTLCLLEAYIIRCAIF
jgi:hypothetical protein